MDKVLMTEIENIINNVIKDIEYSLGATKTAEDTESWKLVKKDIAKAIEQYVNKNYIPKKLIREVIKDDRD